MQHQVADLTHGFSGVLDLLPLTPKGSEDISTLLFCLKRDTLALLKASRSIFQSSRTLKQAHSVRGIIRVIGWRRSCANMAAWG
jgi:hypothetical protein